MSDMTSGDGAPRRPAIPPRLAGMVHRQWRTILAGVLWTTSALFVWAAFSIAPASRPVPVPPALFPRIISIGLFVSATAVLLQKFAEARAAADPDRVVEEPDNPLAMAAEGDEESASSPWDLVVIIGLFSAYLVLLTPLGFHLATAAFVLSAIAFFDRDRLLRALVVATLSTLVIGVVFIEVLRINLPEGLWRLELLDMIRGMVG